LLRPGPGAGAGARRVRRPPCGAAGEARPAGCSPSGVGGGATDGRERGMEPASRRELGAWDADLDALRYELAALIEHRAAEARLEVAVACARARRSLGQRVRRAEERLP